MIINAKIEDAELPKEHYHALLCDPPYHLGPQGFMGKSWDKDGPDAVAFNPATWARLAESLLPGAFGMAFASSRGWHRLAVAIEDAGLIIHPSIFCWNFASGFPKATRIDTQVDAAAGLEREVVSTIRKTPSAGSENMNEGWKRPWAEGKNTMSITAPASELAAAWEGHRYGLQAMKPAIEPIILFQKPYRGKPLDCITSTGAGALHIDGGRVGNGDDKMSGGCAGVTAIHGGGITERAGVDTSCGRWPANFVLDEEAARKLDQQTGELTSGMMKAGTPRQNLMGYAGVMPAETQKDTVGDTGGASRFFHTFGWNHEVEERLDESDPVRYCGKAQRMERNAGLNGHAVHEYGQSTSARRAIVDGRGGTEDAGEIGFNCVKQVQNPHPCVKPIDLTRWLASLLLPPDIYAPRRLLVPFAGSGSEMISGYLAGWDEVTGIEMTPEYIPIAEARIKFWQGWGKDRKPQGYQRESEETKQQGTLF